MLFLLCLSLTRSMFFNVKKSVISAIDHFTGLAMPIAHEQHHGQQCTVFSYESVRGAQTFRGAIALDWRFRAERTHVLGEIKGKLD